MLRHPRKVRSRDRPPAATRAAGRERERRAAEGQRERRGAPQHLLRCGRRQRRVAAAGTASARASARSASARWDGRRVRRRGRGWRCRGRFGVGNGRRRRGGGLRRRRLDGGTGADEVEGRRHTVECRLQDVCRAAEEDVVGRRGRDRVRGGHDAGDLARAIELQRHRFEDVLRKVGVGLRQHEQPRDDAGGWACGAVLGGCTPPRARPCIGKGGVRRAFDRDEHDLLGGCGRGDQSERCEDCSSGNCEQSTRSVHMTMHAAAQRVVAQKEKSRGFVHRSAHCPPHCQSVARPLSPVAPGQRPAAGRLRRSAGGRNVLRRIFAAPERSFAPNSDGTAPLGW